MTERSDPRDSATLAPDDLRASDFVKRFDKLRAALRGPTSQGNIACESCEHAVDCTFCEDSRELVSCHYCKACERCTNCSHCIDCVGGHNLSHCERTERSVRCAYLIDCADCVDCTYCFGCVGLRGKDFHILNEPYDREVYFATVTRLRHELARRVSGHRGNGTR